MKKASESELLRDIQAIFPTPESVPLGIGDDAAAVKTKKGALCLLSTDILVEHVHFELGFSNYHQIGRKAIAVNLSDIAAMGGNPTYFLVSLGLTPRQTIKDIQALYRGMRLESANRWTLIGGNISRCHETFFMSMTAIGEVSPHRLSKRSGAQLEDSLYVTGCLGEAAAGLALLKNGGGAQGEYARLIRRYRTPQARLKEGQLLAQAKIASAMIDLSDGLSQGVLNIAEQSHVGAEIYADQLPISGALRRYALQHGTAPFDLALQGAEDYELLFSVPRSRHRKLNRLIETHVLAARCIGKIVPKRRGCTIVTSEGEKPLKAGGYDHLS